MRVFAIICCVLLLSACAPVPAGVDDYDFRVEVLYEHTVLMKDYANESVLEQIGLDLSYFPVDSSFLTIDLKKEIIRQSYGLESDDLVDLENEMTRMMDEWVEIENIS